jgi:hypothetical protein
VPPAKGNAGNPARAALVAVAALALFCTSCVLGPDPVIARNVTAGGYCASQHVLDPATSHPPPEDVALPAHAAVERGYTRRALDTARAIGALGQVERLAQAEARAAPSAEIVDLRGQLNDAIAIATIDLSSTVAHIECEEGRAGQIASDLREAEQKQTQRLTAYSIVSSSVATIGAGVLAMAAKDPVPGGMVAIAGGVTGGAFGLASLYVHRTATFIHERNILGQLWFGGAHPDFPEIVWAYLTRPQFTREGDRTMRDSVVLTWKQSGRLGGDPEHPAPDRIALYFGQGGTYDADGLEDRADMLSEVREAVDLMNHDLQHLATEATRH